MSSWEAALAALRTTRVTRANLRTVTAQYRALIQNSARSKQWYVVLPTIDAMIRSGIDPTLADFTSAIRACAETHCWHTALELLREMPLRGVQPNVVTYSAAITAVARGRIANSLDLSQSVFASMEQSAIEPDVVCYSALISACEVGAQWQSAIRILDKMESRRCDANVVSFSAAINACEKARQWTAALALFKRMERQRIRPNTITYNALLSACARSGQWRYACELLQRMEYPDVTSHNTVISGCAKSGQWQTALRCFNAMKQNRSGDEPDAITFHAITALRAAAENVPEVARLLVDIEAHARRLALDWAHSTGQETRRKFVVRPLEAVELIETLGGEATCPVREKVRAWVLNPTIEALRRRDVDRLRRFGLAHLGVFTREALDALGIADFDPSAAKQKVLDAGESTETPEVRAWQVVAHVKAGNVDRVVKYGLASSSDALPCIYLNHDRSLHAERQALLQVLDFQGEVELYVTHRPCISCMAAMAVFQKRSPRVVLKVAFAELTGD
eukprot:GEMP01027031.1.p1 GENE.GEMP01027031.1~~GEMP01027031.1.p1  ORF type:complete len:507 (+),score=142.51 GEMP01027031.1:189-1709(+)